MEKVLDVLGFSEYQDGSGDYGYRALRKDNKIVCKVIIMDMVPDYWTDELPEFEYIYNKDDVYIPIESEENLKILIENI